MIYVLRVIEKCMTLWGVFKTVLELRVSLQIIIDIYGYDVSFYTWIVHTFDYLKYNLSIIVIITVLLLNACVIEYYKIGGLLILHYVMTTV